MEEGASRVNPYLFYAINCKMIPRPLGVDFSSSDMQFATVISFNKKPLFTNLPLLKKVIRYIFRKIEIKYIQEALKRSYA